MTMLEKQSPEESPYQHQEPVKRPPASGGRPQQVYIFGKPMDRTINLLRANAVAGRSCQTTMEVMAIASREAVYDTPPF